MEKIHAGAGEKEEGEAERSCYGMTATPIPHPPAPLGPGVEEGRVVRNEGVKLSLERRGFSSTNSILIGNKLDSFSPN